MATGGAVAQSYFFQPLRHFNPFWGEVMPPIVDLTNATRSVWEDATDNVDLAVVEAVTGMGGAVALWRAYRRDADDSSAALRRVYVAEVEDPDAVVDVAAASAAAGTDAVVEFFPTGGAGSPHAQAALGGAALLWAANADGPVMIARLFDHDDPETGPAWSDDHLLLSGGEANAVLRYLDNGTPIVSTAAVMVDFRDLPRGMVVPMGFRTDGRWVWNDAVTYYLRTHALAPEPAFLDHIRRAGPVPATLPLVDRHRAVAALLSPLAEEQT
ncbi:hypothetical protein MRQ36_01790 [Micromonospora sp. R77]|uniref:hypothetical protein n=1 Tax=Micromonospora sp. R77 TaxID=2925836 RepID=UPI001F61C761|nr:hypothetical protein [Micromonospora sp. R77]MCI4061372.1 hypothetical protein [Micromonospora sp. R77]